MNILIGLAFILALMLSESPIESTFNLGCFSNGAMLVAFVLAAPLFAFAQVHYFRRQMTKTEGELIRQWKLIRWGSWTHSAVWFVSSLSIICVFGWPDTVRSVWKLDRLPLLDEVVILMPMLVSLVVSWFVLFDLACSPAAALPTEPVLSRARIDFVSIRCKVYLLVVLMPLAVMVAVKDFWFLLESLPMPVASLLVIGIVLAIFCCLPVMIGLIWKNRSLAPAEGRTVLLELCDGHELRINDIRVWDTGNQAFNALVVGILPKFRLLMVSDLLLKSFPDHELRAIVRHEAGHVRMQHLATRIGFILLPAVALAAMELDANRTLEKLCQQMTLNSGFEISPSLLTGLVFLAYVVQVTAWLSRKMEFEADLYAIGALITSDTVASQSGPAMAQSMASALRRFARMHPDQFNRRSMTHPSLFDRIAMIRTADRNPNSAVQFRRRFLTEQCLLATTILLVTVLILVF